MNENLSKFLRGMSEMALEMKRMELTKFFWDVILIKSSEQKFAKT